MSTRSTRSRVQAVSSTSVPAVLAGGAIVGATLIAAAIRAFSEQGQKAFNAATQHIKATNSDVIAPVSVLRQESKVHEQTIKHILEQSKLPELEATKVETLANISATRY